MNLIDLVAKLPLLMTILSILKDADINKDGKASIAEWTIIVLKLVEQLTKLSPQEKQVLLSFIEFLKANDNGITILIAKLRSSI